jgi:hypothetical protein
MSRRPAAEVGTAYFPVADVPPNGNRPASPARSEQRLRALPRRRRPAMLALAVALAGAGVLVSVTVYGQASHLRPVVVITTAVPSGAVISAGDVGTADVRVPAGIPIFPAAQLSQVIGQSAAEPLHPGTLLAPADLATAQPPGPGQVLIAVAVKPESLPASGLAPGDEVLFVATPGDQGQPGSATGGSALSASVPSVVEAVDEVTDADGFDVVDLLVGDQLGQAVAAQASTGEFALIVTKRND